jgi:hypothetical protein
MFSDLMGAILLTQQGWQALMPPLHLLRTMHSSVAHSIQYHTRAVLSYRSVSRLSKPQRSGSSTAAVHFTVSSARVCFPWCL